MTSIGAPAVSGIILAGGNSLRLGQEKALIDTGSETLIERVVRRYTHRRLYHYLLPSHK